MKNEELAAQVSALQIQQGTIVVVQFKRDVTTDEADRLGKSLRAIVPEENRIIIAANDVEISALDEEHMRELGWVRKSAVDELVASTEHIIDNADEVEWDYYGLQGHEDFNPKEALDAARSAIASVKGGAA